MSESLEPWESVEAGVDVVMFHLGAARTFAQQGDTYGSNAETKLKGKSKTFVFLFESEGRSADGAGGSSRLPGAAGGHGALPHRLPDEAAVGEQGGRGETSPAVQQV